MWLDCSYLKLFQRYWHKLCVIFFVVIKIHRHRTCTWLKKWLKIQIVSEVTMRQLNFLSLTHIFVLLFPVTGPLMTCHNLQDRVLSSSGSIHSPPESEAAQFGHPGPHFSLAPPRCSWGSGLCWDISPAVPPCPGTSFLLLLPCQDLPISKSLSLCSFPQSTLPSFESF